MLVVERERERQRYRVNAQRSEDERAHEDSAQPLTVLRLGYPGLTTIPA